MIDAVLLSGGIDSICLTYGIKPQIAYTIDYGQLPAKREIYVSEYICKELRISHKVITANCRELGSGLLSGFNQIDISPTNEWWPFRNQLLITLALMQGIKDNVNRLHFASVKTDNIHKDGTLKFYELINQLAIFQEGGIEICCDTIHYFSHELAIKFSVPLELLSLAHSCHISNLACGRCPGCIKQLKVKEELGIE